MAQGRFAYLPGAKSGIADALSRLPNRKPETKEFHDLLVPSFNETSYQLPTMYCRDQAHKRFDEVCDRWLHEEQGPP